MNTLKNKEVNTNRKAKDKLPYAVFVCPKKNNNNKIEDYKQVFTDIISDRIQQKYR